MRPAEVGDSTRDFLPGGDAPRSGPYRSAKPSMALPTTITRDGLDAAGAATANTPAARAPRPSTRIGRARHTTREQLPPSGTRPAARLRLRPQGVAGRATRGRAAAGAGSTDAATRNAVRTVPPLMDRGVCVGLCDPGSLRGTNGLPAEPSPGRWTSERLQGGSRAIGQCCDQRRGLFGVVIRTLLLGRGQPFRLPDGGAADPEPGSLVAAWRRGGSERRGRAATRAATAQPATSAGRFGLVGTVAKLA